MKMIMEDKDDTYPIFSPRARKAVGKPKNKKPTTQTKKQLTLERAVESSVFNGDLG